MVVGRQRCRWPCAVLAARRARGAPAFFSVARAGLRAPDRARRIGPPRTIFIALPFYKTPMRTAAAENISIQCKAAATVANSDAHTCTQTSASGSAKYSATLKVGADSSVLFSRTKRGKADAMLMCTPDGTGALGCTYSNIAGEVEGSAYATRTLDPKPSLAYTDKLGNDVTLAWS